MPKECQHCHKPAQPKLVCSWCHENVDQVKAQTVVLVVGLIFLGGVLTGLFLSVHR